MKKRRRKKGERGEARKGRGEKWREREAKRNGGAKRPSLRHSFHSLKGIRFTA
jgi:hypothetical protein